MAKFKFHILLLLTFSLVIHAESSEVSTNSENVAALDQSIYKSDQNSKHILEATHTNIRSNFYSTTQIGYRAFFIAINPRLHKAYKTIRYLNAPGIFIQQSIGTHLTKRIDLKGSLEYSNGFSSTLHSVMPAVGLYFKTLNPFKTSKANFVAYAGFDYGPNMELSTRSSWEFFGQKYPIRRVAVFPALTLDLGMQLVLNSVSVNQFSLQLGLKNTLYTNVLKGSCYCGLAYNF